MASDIDPKRLPDWDQVAMRTYFQVALVSGCRPSRTGTIVTNVNAQCFPFDEECDTDEAVQSIQGALGRLAQQCPQLAGSLFLGNSAQSNLVFLENFPGHIPLEVYASEDETSPDFTYDNLREENFPPDKFVGPWFGIDGSLSEGRAAKRVPVSKVRLLFFPGGMLLWLHLHHSLGDGNCLDMFIESLAAQTRHAEIPCPINVGLEFPPGRCQCNRSLNCLLDACTEYALLPSPTGPTTPTLGRGLWDLPEIEKTGKIFVFSADLLEELRALVQDSSESLFPSRPTIYACLAAFAWVHITRVRFDTELLVPLEERLTDAKLFIPVDWRRRSCFPTSTADYFGNTAATVVATAPVMELAVACNDTEIFARVVRNVTDSIRAVDERWVEDRNALFARIDDPRRLGLNHDPRRPQELGFNTWRFIGADHQWNIPGVPADRPDAIRRSQRQWGMAGALLLPARAHSPFYELLVSLPVCSMEALCEDEQWMDWVDEIVGE